MNCDETILLLADYESGRLSAADMRRVREHLDRCPACAQELQLQRQLDLAIKRERRPEPGAHVHTAFHAWLEAEARAMPAPRHVAAAPERTNIIRVSFWNHPATISGFVAVAACAVFALGLVVGSRTGSSSGAQFANQQNAAEIAALREQVASMSQAVTWQTLQQPNAGDRIQAVRVMASADLNPVDVNQLLGLVAFDSNSQVRESAVQALYRYADRPTVRTAVARALVRESAPVVQLAMIDFLANTRDPEATAALETLVHNQNQNPLVREAATYALTRM
ncbi:MAG: HEAT repeat domain-containing protein [Opitutaceae bacterium]|nr:HEAT repeat domain-containing protein [Opitutaceae bacterium]